ncbi:MAG: FAD synthetase family protein [Chloroflexi bacterium]|nr:FAD synthetase family protein [Chloroflexota bacterium]MCL5275957.1 FAD synthetase family protein [Chloroflexota bacterium]
MGTFDGMHLGHQALLRGAIDDAHTRALPCAVITFFPHPRVVLGRAPAIYLTLPDEKARQMQLLGVDILVVLAFNRETIQTSAAEFVRLMREHLRLTSLWIGEDFALGNKRQGDARFLKEQGLQYGFTVNMLSPVSAGVEPVSSTRIRTALARGDMRDANLCLGRPFRVIGSLVDPQTVCVPETHALPAPGVYPVLVCGRPHQATVVDEPGKRMICLGQAAYCDPEPSNSTLVEFIDRASGFSG